MSLQELARRSGVSYATISRAFNHPEKVHPRTLARIRQLCDDLNYRPRVIPNRLKTVSLVVPSVDQFEPLEGLLVTHIINRLNELDLPSLVTTAEALQRRPTLFQKAFLALIRRDDSTTADILRHFAEQGPFVALNDLDESFSPQASYVGSDHAGGLKMAMDHLWSRGHRRIAFVSRRSERGGHTRRLESFRKWMQRHGAGDETLIFNNDEQYLLEGLRRICESRATAIVVADSGLVLRVLHDLTILGRAVPRDVSLVGQEPQDSAMAFLFPPITCMVHPTRDLARAAVDLLAKLIGDEPVTVPHCTTVPYQLVDRESVRPVKA